MEYLIENKNWPTQPYPFLVRKNLSAKKISYFWSFGVWLLGWFFFESHGVCFTIPSSNLNNIVPQGLPMRGEAVVTPQPCLIHATVIFRIMEDTKTLDHGRLYLGEEETFCRSCSDQTSCVLCALDQKNTVWTFYGIIILLGTPHPHSMFLASFQTWTPPPAFTKRLPIFFLTVKRWSG